MHIVWRAHCPNCDISWQRYETDFETGWGSCPKCGVLMNIVSTTVREKLDLGPGWHRIVVLPEESETAEDVVEREVQRWRDGDESDDPDEDRISLIVSSKLHEIDASQRFRSDLINAGDNWKAQQERMVQTYQVELTRWQKEFFKHSAMPLLKPQSRESLLDRILRVFFRACRRLAGGA